MTLLGSTSPRTLLDDHPYRAHLHCRGMRSKGRRAAKRTLIWVFRCEIPGNGTTGRWWNEGGDERANRRTDQHRARRDTAAWPLTPCPVGACVRPRGGRRRRRRTTSLRRQRPLRSPSHLRRTRDTRATRSVLPGGRWTAGHRGAWFDVRPFSAPSHSGACPCLVLRLTRIIGP